MYKTKINQWGLDKRNKRSEVLAMLRKKRERATEGKDTLFMLRDRVVDDKDIERYRKRNRISLDHGTAAFGHSPPTPEGLVCVTPPAQALSPLTLPEVLRVPEKFLYDIAQYIKGSFDTGQWIPREGDADIMSSKSETDRLRLQSILDGFSIGCNNYWAGRIDIVGLYWRRAFRDIDKAVQSTHYQNLMVFTHQIWSLRERGFPELATMMQQYLSSLGRALIPLRRGCHSIYIAFATLNLGELGELEDRIGICFADQFDAILGPNYASFQIRTVAAEQRLSRNPLALLDDYFPNLAELDACFGKSSS